MSWRIWRGIEEVHVVPGGAESFLFVLPRKCSRRPVSGPRRLQQAKALEASVTGLGMKLKGVLVQLANWDLAPLHALVNAFRAPSMHVASLSLSDPSCSPGVGLLRWTVTGRGA